MRHAVWYLAMMGLWGCGAPQDPPPVNDTLWEWCPSFDDAVFDDNGAHTIEVGPGALYCGTFDERRLLEQEYWLKAKLRFIPGTYRVPSTVENAAVHLPFCVQFLEMDGLTSSGQGTVTSTTTEFDDVTRFTVQLTHAMTAENGDTYSFKANFSNTEEHSVTGTTFVLDGSPSAVFQGPIFDVTLCTTGSDECFPRRQFVSCMPETYQRQEHEVVFDGGDVRLTVQMGQSMASTEPAAFVRAEGMLDGVSFDQQEYYKLIYNPEHHHFARDFAVLFDTPIQGACGLKIRNLDPSGQSTKSILSTVDCTDK